MLNSYIKRTAIIVLLYFVSCRTPPHSVIILPQNTFSEANQEQLIAKTYEELLDRNIEPIELNNWLEEIRNNDIQFVDFIKIVIGSPEFYHSKLAGRTVGESIDSIYYRLLERAPFTDEEENAEELILSGDGVTSIVEEIMSKEVLIIVKAIN